MTPAFITVGNRTFNLALVTHVIAVDATGPPATLVYLAGVAEPIRLLNGHAQAVRAMFAKVGAIEDAGGVAVGSVIVLGGGDDRDTSTY